MKRVLLTGSAGGVGAMFRDWARDRYAFVCFDRVPTPGVPEAIVASLTDLPVLEAAVAGCDAVLHLGAYPIPADFATVIAPSNVLGTYHAYEAAHRAGVPKFVFASSVHVEFGNPPGARVSVDLPPQPRNVYAASKLFGERVGLIYSGLGMSVLCLRLGGVMVPTRHDRMLRNAEVPDDINLTARDCCEILARSLDVEGVPYAILPAFSRNAAAVRDLSPLTTVLGYEPQDDTYALYPLTEEQKARRATQWWRKP